MQEMHTGQSNSQLQFLRKLSRSISQQPESQRSSPTGQYIVHAAPSQLNEFEAFQDYNAKRYQDSNIHVSAVSDAPVTCEDGFKEIQGLVSPLTNTNNVTFQLCAISLSILTLSSA
ncbi:putative invertase inhibitor [Hibiscus syriacus]|uniref:Invertase inhibitor n=1 Tax=Hibiscus syriacus TaxID=106335 RepID=A0A6A2YEH5_HIBSY|nr:putative invertase inhibitor [Hibiscus syriacus]